MSILLLPMNMSSTGQEAVERSAKSLRSIKEFSPSVILLPIGAKFEATIAQAQERGKRIGLREIGKRHWGAIINYAETHGIRVYVVGRDQDEGFSDIHECMDAYVFASHFCNKEYAKVAIACTESDLEFFRNMTIVK